MNIETISFFLAYIKHHGFIMWNLGVIIGL